MGGKKKDKYNYYKFLLRTKDALTRDDLKGMKRALWLYLGNIPITDVHASKGLNAGGIRFEEVVRT